MAVTARCRGVFVPVAGVALIFSAACGGEAADGGVANDSVVPSVGLSIADTSLAAFWRRFRDAVASGDTAAILALTDRTFETRGEMDGMPWVRRDSAQVVALLDSLMRTDPGLGSQPTMREFVAATSVIGPKFEGGPAEFRVGSFVFEKRQGAWKFSKAYMP